MNILDREKISSKSVTHPRLGKMKIPGVVPKFSESPGSVRNVDWAEDVL
jgi:formyl-CoA transferase